MRVRDWWTFYAVSAHGKEIFVPFSFHRSQVLQKAKSAYSNYRHGCDNLSQFLGNVPNYEPQETDSITQVENKLRNQRVRELATNPDPAANLNGNLGPCFVVESVLYMNKALTSSGSRSRGCSWMIWVLLTFDVFGNGALYKKKWGITSSFFEFCKGMPGYIRGNFALLKDFTVPENHSLDVFLCPRVAT